MNEDKEPRPVPPVFSSEQAQNKAECAAIWYAYAAEAEQSGDDFGARMGYVNAWHEQPEELRYYEGVLGYFHRSELLGELLKTYQIGTQIHPHHEPTFINFPNLLNLYGHYEEAKNVSETWLSRNSRSLEAWGNLGNSFRGLGDFEQAKACFLKVLKVDPKHAIAGFNYSNILLAQGNFEEGWVYYNYRLNLTGYENLQKRNAARIWTGQSLKGKSIFVFAEQGIGDTLMFCRYLHPLVKKGAKVFFESQKSVAWILRNLLGNQVEVIERETLEEKLDLKTDYQIPLLSLPGLLDKGEPMAPASESSVKEIDSPRAKELISGLEGFKVGLCWQGNPRAAIDLGRSVSLAFFESLMSNSWADFVSLQGRDGLEDIEAFASEFNNFHYLIDLDVESGPFAETVSLIQGLDLVITTDTSIAHLAALLGKECWVILQKYPEWRWGLDGEESVWYSGVRLFRQKEIGEWESVIEELNQALKEDVPQQFD
ncbi:MAG: tetratricopeptide repeat protein [Opitutales bacterium]|nr:tetratricopeptide repeat protein [Opitutales bacterium]